MLYSRGLVAARAMVHNTHRCFTALIFKHPGTGPLKLNAPTHSQQGHTDHKEDLRMLRISCDPFPISFLYRDASVRKNRKIH